MRCSLLVFPVFVLRFAAAWVPSAFLEKNLGRLNLFPLLVHHDDFEVDRRDFLAFSSTSLSTLVGLAPNVVEAAAEVSIDEKSFNKEPIESSNQAPFSSVRRYKTVVLPNGLRALLISDKSQQSELNCQVALSIGGAGQFSDPDDIPGLAHLLEHCVLSDTKTSPFRKPEDFEDWLSSKDGASNGYTAFDAVCFNYAAPSLYFQESLERFAALFIQENLERQLGDETTIRRETLRVNSEFDPDNTSTQSYYLAKAFVAEHPFSRFGMGNIETLERRPKELNLNVKSELFRFFLRYYQPKEAILVIVAPQDLSTLTRWVSPFANTLSKQPNVGLYEPAQKYIPGRFLRGGTKLKHMVLLCKKQGNAASEDTERLTIQWILNIDYSSAILRGEAVVTASQVAFCLAQILGRRGPGSLYFFLLRRGWIPPGTAGIPKVSLPVQVSGFQMIKLDVLLSKDGFLNRSAVVAAVYDCLDGLKISRELVTQWASVAKLFGFALAARAPDAVEFTQDFRVFGFDAIASVGEGNWYRFPSPEDRNGIKNLRKSLLTTLAMMNDPDSAVVIVTASAKSLLPSGLPPLTSRKWNTEPVTGGRFLFEDMLGLASRVEERILTRVIAREELLPPSLNPLVPLALRPARLRIGPSQNGAFWLDKDSSAQLPRIKSIENDWLVLFPDEEMSSLLPRGPPEAKPRAVFIIQLLSSRPARAGIRQAAQGELWKIALDMALVDLAELGAPGALAYDVTFNKYGMRIAILGISQNIASYTRRICRRLVQHSNKLLSGPEFFPKDVTFAAVNEINRARGISGPRKRQLVSSVRRSTCFEAAAEGLAFLNSCDGAYVFGQGDLLRFVVS